MGKTEKDTKHDPPSLGEDLTNRRMYDVPLASLDIDPNQPRKHFDEEAMTELVASVSRHGILQPVIFRRDAEGSLILVSGERRFRAAKQAGKETIPGVFIEGGNTVEIALVENLLRENLNPIEEAEALQRLKEEGDYTQEQISEVIGKAVSTISEILSLNRLPESIKDECRDNSTFSRRMLVEVAREGTPEAMLTLFEKVKGKGQKTREAVAGQRRGQSTPAQTMKGKIRKFSEVLGKADFTEFGTKRAGVESELRALLTLIQAKLGEAA